MAMTQQELTIPELTLGDRLLLARKKAGITRERMAGLLGVAVSAVGHWETDRSRPKDVLAVAKKWSEITETPQDWLLLGSTYARYLEGRGQGRHLRSLTLADLSCMSPESLHSDTLLSAGPGWVNGE